MNVRYIVMALFTFCTLLVVAVPAGAQDVDLGNDGVDMNCEDFAEFNAVSGYFTNDGGSAERNVDNLNPNGDGIPCNEDAYDGEDGSGEPGDEPVTVVDSAAPVTRLPETGSGSTAGGSNAGVLALAATLAALAAAVISNLRQRELV